MASKNTVARTKVKYAAIKRYVDFRISRTPTPAERAKVSRYFTRLHKYLSRGYVMVSKGTIAGRKRANTAAHLRLPDLRVGLAIPGPSGSQPRALKDGSIVWKTPSAEGIDQCLIPASFFDLEIVDTGEAEEEALRIVKTAKTILGARANQFAIKYVNGQGNSFDPKLLADHLCYDANEYHGTSHANLAVGVVAFRCKFKGSNLERARRIDAMKQNENIRRNKQRKKWRGDL